MLHRLQCVAHVRELFLYLGDFELPFAFFPMTSEIRVRAVASVLNDASEMKNVMTVVHINPRFANVLNNTSVCDCHLPVDEILAAERPSTNCQQKIKKSLSECSDTLIVRNDRSGTLQYSRRRNTN